MSLYRNIYTGLTAGAIAALVAIGASIPLISPDDALFNSASVGFAILAMGAVNGILWNWADPERWLNRRYLLTSIALLFVALGIAGSVQTQLDNATEFTIPLAMIGVVATLILTPLLNSNEKTEIWRNGFLALIAVVVSIALAGQGDQESGSLSLPPPP
jgi:hypothetical protein